MGLSIGCHGDNMRKLGSGDFILSFFTFGSTVLGMIFYPELLIIRILDALRYFKKLSGY